jgi:polysaccharide export outer membrane protein
MMDPAAANLPAQKIGADDLLAVSVYDSPEMTRTVRVGADGMIRLPMMKQRIQVKDMMPGEVESAIAEALTAEELLVNPLVTVTVAEYHSRPISVVGAVRKPVTFQAEAPVTLLNALARAEGLSSDAGQEILISRVQAGATGESSNLVQRIRVKELIDGADPAANLKLIGGEEIRVPEAGRVYVVGNVKKPGAFTVQDNAETTVLKALAMAEGLLPFAGKQAFIYRAEGGPGGQNEIPVELRRIMDRKSPDVALLPNDILYITDNKNRRLSLGALEKISIFGAAVASALIYAGVR